MRAGSTHAGRPQTAGLLRRIVAARWSYALLLPIVVVYGVFSLWPIAETVVLSFFDAKLADRGEFVGLENYTRFFEDEEFRQAARNTAVFTLVCSVGSIALSLPLAAMLHLRLTRASTLFKVLFFLPVITPGAAIGYVWKWIYDTQSGLANEALGAVGIGPVGWLSDSNVALWAVATTMVWSTAGYFIVIFLAQLQSVDPAIYEAADVDGAGQLRQFWSITVPLIRRAVLLVVILGIIFFMQAFVLVITMTRGGPGGATELLTTLAYEDAFQNGVPRLGLAAASSTILFATILVCTLVAFAVGRLSERRR